VIEAHCENQYGREDSGAILTAMAMENRRRQVRLGKSARGAADLDRAVAGCADMAG
jgi:hypothetical protein